jgi:hypothetical protein
MGSSTETFIALYLNVVPTILSQRDMVDGGQVSADRQAGICRQKQAEAGRCRRAQAGEVLRLTSRARPLRAAGP